MVGYHAAVNCPLAASLRNVMSDTLERERGRALRFDSAGGQLVFGFLGNSRMRREIEAPDKPLLSAREAAAWLNVPERTWEDLVASGVIPPGITLSARTVRWAWEVVWATKVLLPHLVEIGGVKK